MTDEAVLAIRLILSKPVERAQKAVSAYIPNKGEYLSPEQVQKLHHVRELLREVYVTVSRL
jgi:hypothetical protein